MASWVVDAGPVIHLDQIGHLRLLKRLSPLVVPASVARELTAIKTSAESRAFTSWPNVTVSVAPPESPRPLATLTHRTPLQRGEVDCLRLALAMRSCVFLTDDLAARTVAEKLHVEVHGTVGVIAYAVKRQWLSVSNAEEALKALYHRSSLFITYTIIERAIQHLRQVRY